MCERWRRGSFRSGLALALTAAWTAACADADPGPAEWRAQVDTIGDTVVVRTLGGSEWGEAVLVPELRIGALEGEEHEMFGAVQGLAVAGDGNIYVYDRQVPALRKYGPDGEHLGTLGREGEGPGEYRNSDGGLAVLADGRVVLRDPGNGRFTVYGPDGTFLETWPARGGTFTMTPIYPVGDGGFYNPVFGGGQPMRLVRHEPDGTPADTLSIPDRGIEPPRLTARAEGISQTWFVPFWPRAVWTFHADGHFVSAVTDRYAVDLLREDGSVLRIEKEADPVPVSREERAAEEERVVRVMRRVDSSWRWDGPPIPQEKPLMRALFPGEDGRVWVQLHRPGERVPDDELDPGPGGERPIPRIQEPVVFDVFESDGRYLGRVTAPEGFSTGPRPIFRGEHVWATSQDDLGVPYVVRYRIEAEAEGSTQGG